VVGFATPFVGHEIPWVELNGSIVVSDGVFVIAFLLMRAASVLVRVNKLWIEPDSLIIVSDGTVEIALGVIR
jgi:hypothetical protein